MDAQFFVLENSLQSNRPHHKWKERSKVGIYLGPSPQHERNVALVLSRTTGLVSPQFHVKFYLLFQTVKQGELESEWQDKTVFVIQRELSPKTMNEDQNKVSEGDKTLNPEGVKNPTKSSRYTNIPDKGLLLQQVGSHEPTSQKRLKSSTKKQSDPSNESNRIRTENGKSVERVINTDNFKSVNLGKVPSPQQQIEGTMTEIQSQTIQDIEGEIMCLQALYPQNDLDTNQDDILVLKASADSDTMYLHEALKEPDIGKFIKAMKKEVEDQMNNGNFTIIHKNNIPQYATVLPAV